LSAGAHFGHSSDIWRDFPALVPGVLAAEGVTSSPSVDEQVARFETIARARLATSSEGELPEIRAWRRTFTQMGLKPTQYRCASEALLRRFRKDGSLPRIHPLVDLCNAISLAYAIPVAAFDRSRVAGCLEVRYASGDESYITFAGDRERPDPGEVIFADDAGHAHARRWTNRQSGPSAVRERTNAVLVVAEAMHASAADDIRALLADLAREVESAWGVTPRAEMLSAAVSRFAW
jgi:DNA/RNA-binding domain of Phe-tRNA-synthetase-like protein